MNPDAEARAVHERDQEEAAARAADAALTRFARSKGEEVSQGTRSPWLDSLLEDLSDRFRDGSVRACHHLGESPEVLHAAAWRPGVVACGRCAGRVLQPRLLERYRCDRCRKRDYSGVLMGMARAENLLFSFGLCDGCCRLLQAEDAAGDTNP